MLIDSGEKTGRMHHPPSTHADLTRHPLDFPYSCGFDPLGKTLTACVRHWQTCSTMGCQAKSIRWQKLRRDLLADLKCYPDNLIPMPPDKRSSAPLLPPKIAAILEAAAKGHGISVDCLRYNAGHGRPIIAAKREAAVQLRQLELSLHQIGWYLGGMHHASVHYLLRGRRKPVIAAAFGARA